jgi:hypothetical protein
MTPYLIDSNLGSQKRMCEIHKFLDYTKNRPDSFILVYGGKKYKEEVAKIGNLAKYIVELKHKKQAVEIPEKVVDDSMEYYDKYSNSKYDDPHIFALVTVSECKVVATQDSHICEFYDKMNEVIIGNKPEFFYKSDALYQSFISKYK